MSLFLWRSPDDKVSPHASRLFFGGDGGIDTSLYIANVPLSHLSYIPTLLKGFKDSRGQSRHRLHLNPQTLFCRKPHVPKGRTIRKNFVSPNGPAPGGEPLGDRHPASDRSAMPIFWGDSWKESDRMPLQKLDNSASERKPLGELGKAKQ